MRGANSPSESRAKRCRSIGNESERTVRPAIGGISMPPNAFSGFPFVYVASILVLRIDRRQRMIVLCTPR